MSNIMKFGGGGTADIDGINEVVAVNTSSYTTNRAYDLLIVAVSHSYGGQNGANECKNIRITSSTGTIKAIGTATGVSRTSEDRNNAFGGGGLYLISNVASGTTITTAADGVAAFTHVGTMVIASVE